MTREIVPPVDKVNIGVIGAGWWATTLHLPELKADPRVRIAAVNRIGKPELEKVRTEFGAAAAYEDYKEMLAKESLQGVIVASPHTFHFEHARAALQHGAHVLVEKPMTTHTEDARALVRLAKARRLELMIAYGWNFAPMIQQARQLVANNAIGRVRHVSLHMASAVEDLFSGRDFLEARDAMFRPAASTWSDPSKAGGYGWGQLTHALGILFRITDLAPVEVSAITNLSEAGVDMHDAAIVRFADGVTGVLSAAGTVPKHLGYQIDIRIFGSEGMLLFDIETERLEVRRHDRADVVVPLAPGSGAYPRAAPIRAFIDICCGAAAQNDAPGIVGQRATETLDAMYRSATSGRPETVPSADSDEA